MRWFNHSPWLQINFAFNCRGKKFHSSRSRLLPDLDVIQASYVENLQATSWKNGFSYPETNETDYGASVMAAKSFDANCQVQARRKDA